MEEEYYYYCEQMIFFYIIAWLTSFRKALIFVKIIFLDILKNSLLFEVSYLYSYCIVKF